MSEVSSRLVGELERELEEAELGGHSMSREEIEHSVRRALGRTKNGSAPGSDGISYRLIKAI